MGPRGAFTTTDVGESAGVLAATEAAFALGCAAARESFAAVALEAPPVMAGAAMAAGCVPAGDAVEAAGDEALEAG